MNQDQEQDQKGYFASTEQINPSPNQWQYTSGQLQQPQAPAEQADVDSDEPLASWSATEFVAHEKSSSWYVFLAVGATVVSAVMYLVTRDWLSAGVVLFLALVAGVYASAKPKTAQYNVMGHGLFVNDKYYGYETLKSFSVITETGFPYLQILSQKRFAVPLNIYLPADRAEEIIDVLTSYIAYDQKRLDIVDRITNKIRF